MMRLKFKKNKGSSLPIVLIFSFVVLVTISAMAYNFSTDLKSIIVLLKDDNYDQANQDNIDNLPDSDYTIGTQVVGEYKFVNTIVSTDASLYSINTSAELYDAEAHVINYQIQHEIYHNDAKLSTEIVSINKLPDFASVPYSKDMIPLNVPYVNIKGFSDNQKLQMLNKDNQINDNILGNIGFIKKEESKLVLNINGRTQEIDFSQYDLDKNYKVSLGWGLNDGNWQLNMAVYDQKHLLLSTANLSSLENNSTFNQAALDLSNFKTISNKNVLNDVVSAKWYFNGDQSTPRLLVAMGKQSSKNKTAIKILDVRYNQKTDRYKAKNKGTINDLGRLNPKQFHIQALDPNATFAASDIILVAGNHLYDIGEITNKNISKLSKTPIVLDSYVDKNPIIVKKDDGGFYILTYDDEAYYQYNYALGSRVISGEKITAFEGEKLEKIIIRDGVKYIVTTKHIYVVNFDNDILNKINTDLAELNQQDQTNDDNKDEQNDPQQDKKIIICHKPGTNAEKTLTVSRSAVLAHLGHGDYLGACTSSDIDNSSKNSNSKNNNGHGNNQDGVDSSNPGNSKKHANDTSYGVDDEKSSNSKNNGKNK